MVIVLKKDITSEQKGGIKDFLVRKHYRLNEIEGEEDTVIAAVGRGTADRQELEGLAGVASVIPISKPYKMASREFRRDNTVVDVPNSRGQHIRIGGQRIAVIAGPRTVESRDQIFSVAKAVAASGAVMLRGGTFGQSASPYSFQGLGEKGLAYLKEAGESYGLPVVTEIVSPA
ncbi:MAG TPA: phospho-2-dehydro-3-deoxyheptonate aldolase, partial [Treponema sp.]|nr:phospho-2-dehydro-3-deoxyheptonate aldolase [Treponema sp.]